MSDFLKSIPLSIPDVLHAGRPVRDGEPVNAAVTNRLPSVNAANTEALHALIKTFRDFSGEYLWQMPIDGDTKVGDFVYFDSQSHVFKPGLARFTVEDRRVYESETSQVWGVVKSKDGDKATICTNGLCTFHPGTDVYANSPVPGIRYLSDTASGAVTTDAKYPCKCVGFLVGSRSSGEVQFFVRPYLAIDPRIHQHLSHRLAAVPAGDWDYEDPVLTNPANEIPGWLPAGTGSPAGAVYGYNPNFLKNCGWPIRYPSTARLRWQRVAEGIPLLAEVPPELYLIDETTIWWLSDVLLPWNTEVKYVKGEIVSSSADTEYEHCMWLSLTNFGYDLSDNQVTTLRANKKSGLYVRQYPYGGDAVSGDLEIGLNLAFNEVQADGLGYAVGGIKEDAVRMTPIVSKLRSDSDFIRVRAPYRDKDGYYHGAITISDPTGIVGSEVPIEATHLNGVEEVLIEDAVGLSFPKDRPSSLLTQLLVPYKDILPSLALSVRLGILVPGSAAPSAKILSLSYRVIKNPSAPNTMVPAFSDPSSAKMEELKCDFSVTGTAASYGYYFVESEQIDVSPGDIVIVKMERRTTGADRFVVLRKSGILHFSGTSETPKDDVPMDKNCDCEITWAQY